MAQARIYTPSNGAAHIGIHEGVGRVKGAFV